MVQRRRAGKEIQLPRVRLLQQRQEFFADADKIPLPDRKRQRRIVKDLTADQ